jgi:eukaryotic-like serine/threonine-protein kinase
VNTSPHPLIGRTLDGRYRIESVAARGGMAIVFLATDLRLRRPVALKVMHQSLAEDPQFVERFRREARAAAALTHPHVVSVHDQGLDEETGAVYLVMELIQGHNVRDLLSERGPLTPVQALAVMDPLLQALDAAHQAGFVHRDIKPENIMISDSGRIKVTDFGLARAIADGQTHATTRGVLLGTVSYLSPEQVEQGKADERSDIYSAGIVLFEMLTGQVPHSAESPIAVAFQHVHGDIPVPSEFRKGIPASVDALVQKATQRDAKNRFQSAEEFLDAVKKVRHLVESGDFDSSPILIEKTSETKLESKPTEILDRRKPKQFRKKRNVILSLLLLFTLSVGGFFVAQTLNSVSVPQLIGLTENAARSALENRELSAVVIKEFNDTVEVGTVIEAIPKSGSNVSKDSEVQLIVSKGPELFEIPDVIGQLWVDVEVTLRDLGFDPTLASEEHHSEFPVGTVIEIDPPAFSREPSGTLVSAVVSKGPAPIPLPNVVNSSELVATKKLQEKGFQDIVIRREFSASIKKGNVISMTPAAKTKHFSTITVELIISDGPPPVKVPNVTGMTFKKAIQTLAEAGLKYKIRTQNACKKPKSRIVQQQFSAANTLVPRGSTIELGIYNNC